MNVVKLDALEIWYFYVLASITEHRWPLVWHVCSPIDATIIAVRNSHTFSTVLNN